MRRLQSAALNLVEALNRRRPLTATAIRQAEACCEAPDLQPAEAPVEPPGARGAWLIVSGWAAEQRTLPDGRRQILRLLLPGDISGVSDLAPGEGGELQTLTGATLADVGDLRAAIRTGEADPSLVEAWKQLQRAQEASDLRHLMRLGRLSALERTAQLLIELYERQAFAGLTHGQAMPLPLTQIQLADHLGLSVVHINRVLQRMRREGFIEMRPGQVLFRQLTALASLSFYELGTCVAPGPPSPQAQLRRTGLSR